PRLARGFPGAAFAARPRGRGRGRRGRRLGDGLGRPAVPHPPRVSVAVRHRPGPGRLRRRRGGRRGRLPGRVRRRAGGHRAQPDPVRLLPGLRAGHRRDDHAAGVRAVRRAAVHHGGRRPATACPGVGAAGHLRDPPGRGRIGAAGGPGRPEPLRQFGPRGLNSLLFALLVVDQGVRGGEELLAVVGVVVIVSVVAHGATATPFSGWYARKAE